MNQDKIKFIHLRDRWQQENGRPLGNGGCTIAYKYTKTNSNELVPVEFAWAECNPKDNFSKKSGRLKASAKLNSSSHRSTVIEGTASNSEVMDYLKEIYYLEREERFPDIRLRRY